MVERAPRLGHIRGPLADDESQIALREGVGVAALAPAETILGQATNSRIFEP